MPLLVAVGEENLVRRFDPDRRVPHHNALRRAETGDVRVRPDESAAGVHQKNAVRRNLQTAAGGHALQLLDQSRVGISKRREVVEERIDDQRGGESEQHHHRHGKGPEPNPPASRRTAHQRVENAEDHNAEKQRQHRGFQPVQPPCGPALDRKSEAETNAMPHERRRDFQRAEDQQPERRSDQPLHPRSGRYMRRQSRNRRARP